jgi:hypothetical protein
MIPVDPRAGYRIAQARAHLTQATEEAEEEALTPYTPASLAGDWEFKIIRSAFKQFGNSEVRERVLAEEGLGDWVLVEVFDDARIRLKRERVARPQKATEGYDPYRTQIPFHPAAISPAQMAMARVLLTGLAVGAIVATLYATGVLP